MSDYLETIASIGNLDARMAELVRRVEEGGPDAIPLLMAALADAWAPLRMRAANMLAERLDLDTERRLVTFVTQGGLSGQPVTWTEAKERDIRRMVPLALRTPSLSQVGRDALVGLLADRDEVVRYHTMLASFVALEEESLRDAVAIALSDDDPAVVVVGAQIAAHIGWSVAIPKLKSRRGQLRWEDRMHLTLALAEFGPLLEHETLQSVVDDLLEGLENRQTFAASAKALGELAPPRAIEPLRKAAQRFFAHPLLKVEAAAALAKMGDEFGIEQIGKTLNSRRRDTRGYALQLVGEFKSGAYRAELERVARDPDDWHADTAVLALANWTDAYTRSVIEEVAREHPKSEVREAALEALELQRASSFTGELDKNTTAEW